MAWKDYREALGGVVGAVGTLWGLPEWGLSERLGGTAPPKYTGMLGSMYGLRGYLNELGQPKTVQGAQDEELETGSSSWGAQPSGGKTIEAPTTAPLDTGPTAAERASWDAAYTTAMGGYASQLNEIENARLNIMDEASKFRKSYQKELGKLGTEKESTLSGQKAFFTNISPDVYQSQEENYRNKVLQEYQTGVSELGGQKASKEAILGRGLSSLEGSREQIQQAQQAAQAEYEATGQAPPEIQGIYKGIRPNFGGYDITPVYQKLSQLYLMNTLRGLTPQQNMANVKGALDKQDLEPDIKDYLYQTLFPQYGEYMNQV